MYVVSGASGNTGKVVATKLLEAGKKVRALVRDASKASDLARAGAEVVTVDLSDRAGLERALAGAAGFYMLSPPNAASTSFVAERKHLLEGVADAVKAAGVQHVVYLSSIGAQAPAGIIATAAAGEASLRRVGIPRTFVRPGYFVENWAAVLPVAKQDGVLPSFLPGDRQVPMVSTVDIGALAAKALLDGPRGERILELSGPSDPTPKDVAAVVGKLLGKPVQLVEPPLDAVVPTFTSFGISNDVASLYRDMYVGFHAGKVVFEGGKAEQHRGATSLEQTLRALAG
jgi:uncharacterized protein YbjT (DUF2867 family)